MHEACRTVIWSIIISINFKLLFDHWSRWKQKSLQNIVLSLFVLFLLFTWSVWWGWFWAISLLTTASLLVRLPCSSQRWWGLAGWFTVGVAPSVGQGHSWLTGNLGSPGMLSVGPYATGWSPCPKELDWSPWSWELGVAGEGSRWGRQW